jgi:methylated-DNA-[protein]-cysteine S-methyltransferase
MHSRISIASVDSPLGEISLAAGEHGLIAVSLGKGLKPLVSTLQRPSRDNGSGRHHPDNVLEQACEELVEYLLNARERFETPLDLSCGTEFQRAVWRRLRRVKYGSHVTYTSLAESIGRPGATRAVGNAVGANPLLVMIPCHRVLASNGGIGGFSAGLPCKRKLLAIEGIVAS